jgi:hypothetical protein
MAAPKRSPPKSFRPFEVPLSVAAYLSLISTHKIHRHFEAEREICFCLGTGTEDSLALASRNDKLERLVDGLASGESSSLNGGINS